MLRRRCLWGLAAAALLALLAAGGTRRAAGGEPAPEAEKPMFDPADCIAEVTLDKAAPGDKPLTLHLDRRGGAVRAAFGVAPAFNKAPHDVDAGGLTLTRSRLSGRVNVTINPDAFTPKDGKPIACAYTLDAAVKAGRATGKFKGARGQDEVAGAVTGRLQPRPRTPRPARITVDMPDAVLLDKTHKWQRHAIVRFVLAGGKPCGGIIRPPGSSTYAEWSGAVESLQAALDAGRLTATVAAALRGSRGTARNTFALEAAVIGTAVAGRFKTAADGKPAKSGRFLGTLQPVAVDPADCLCTLELHRALAGGKMLRVLIRRRAGEFGYGVGIAPCFNRVLHDVDPSGLALREGRLAGAMKVTVNPDPWVPRDHKPVACTFQLKAHVRHGTVRGEFTGTYGSEKLGGLVAGELQTPPETPEPAAVWLKFENGLTGSNAWHNRAFVNFTLAGGNVSEGKFFTNKRCWKGTFDGAEVRLADGRLKGTIRGTITEGRVSHGAYVFTIDARVVGTVLVGTFRTTFGGKQVKSGPLVGGLSPPGP